MNNLSAIEKIQENYNHLSPTEKMLAVYVLKYSLNAIEYVEYC